MHVTREERERRAQRRRWRSDPFSRAWRFWSQVGEPDANGCRVWNGTTRTFAGYGIVGKDKAYWGEKLGGGYVLAHRVAWMEANGEPPPKTRKMHVRHICDNPPCCEPSHLILETAAENAQDCSKKGRLGLRGMPRGSHHSEETRRKMREWWASLSPEKRVAHCAKAAAHSRSAKERNALLRLKQDL